MPLPVQKIAESAVGGFTILVIDDQPTGRLIVSEILRELAPGTTVMPFGDSLEALEFAAGNDVDLVLTDYRMPGLDGVETIRRLRLIPHLADVPLICVTVVGDRDVKLKALEAGANDFLVKPVDPYETAARCRNLLALRRQQLINREYTHDLEAKVVQATKDIRRGEMETLLRLARVAEQRDSITGYHLIRMAKYSALLAAACGWDAEEQGVLELAAPLHDIGKISMPDSILQARRALTDEEMDVMRTHAQLGYEMLQGSHSHFLETAAVIALGHHEKFDGSGYPHGHAGEDIHIAARIVAIADVFDALTSVRQYKSAWSVADAVGHMKVQAGRHFDPKLLEIFLGLSEEINSVMQAFRDP